MAPWSWCPVAVDEFAVWLGPDQLLIWISVALEGLWGLYGIVIVEINFIFISIQTRSNTETQSGNETMEFDVLAKFSVVSLPICQHFKQVLYTPWYSNLAMEVAGEFIKLKGIFASKTCLITRSEEHPNSNIPILICQHCSLHLV